MMDASVQELDILQKLECVEREIAEARKQALYRDRLKDTCFLQGYCAGKFSLILDLEAGYEIDDEFPIEAFGCHGIASLQFTVFISHDYSSNVSNGVETKQQNMFVRNVEVVKSPDGRIVPSPLYVELF